MPWLFTIPEFVKKRACRYLLQHYLGQYLEEKIQLEDLTVDLYNGTGTITNVPLNVEAINEALEGTGTPVRVVSGYLGQVTISVPWSALMSDSCRVKITGLTLSVMPCIRSSSGEDSTMMTDSLFFGVMSNSMQMAQEVLKSGPVDGEERDKEGGGGEGRAAFEGMEALARAIETVLSRVQIDLKDTVVQVVYRSQDYTHQYFIRVRVQSIKFYDELSGGAGESSVDEPPQEETEASRPAAVATKVLELSQISVEVGGAGEDVHTASMSPEDLPGVPVACASGDVNVSVKVRGVEGAPVPRVQLEATVGGIHCLLAPAQVHILTEMAHNLGSTGGAVSNYEQLNTGQNRPIPGKDMRDIESQLRHHRHEERKRREHRQDLLRADPYKNSMQREASRIEGLTGSTATSADMFYSLNLHDSFLESGQSDLGDRSMESSLCTTAASSAMADSYTSSIHSRRKSPDSIFSQYGGGTCSSGSLESIPLSGGTGLQQLAHSPEVKRRGRNKESTFGNTSAGTGAQVGAGITQQDVCKYSLTLSGITVAILEANPAYTHPVDKSWTQQRTTEPSSTGPSSSLHSSGLDPMTYLSAVAEVLSDGVNRREIQKHQERLAQTLPQDHLFLWLSTVKTGVSVQGVHVDLQLTVASCELWEFLYRNAANLPHITTPVSAAPLVELTEDVSLSRPCIRLKVSSTVETSRKRHRQGHPDQVVSVDLSLTSPHVNLDPTLAERLQPLLCSSSSSSGCGGSVRGVLSTSQPQLKHSLYMTTSNYHSINLERQALFNQAVSNDSQSSQEQRVNIKLNTSSVSLSLRFPVPEMNESQRRLPWYHPSLRQEVLYVTLSHLTLTSTLHPHLPHTSSIYDAHFTRAEAYLSCDGSVEGRELFLTIGTGEEQSLFETTGERPRMQLVVQPVNDSVLEQLNKFSAPSSHLHTHTRSHPHVLDDVGIGLMEGEGRDATPEPSPFSTKKDMYSGKGGTQDVDESSPQEHTEHLVTPASRTEMEEFEQFSSSLARYCLSFHLPTLCLHLPSKRFLEILYNRFTTDLALWRPASPELVERANAAKSLFFSSVDIQPAATAEEKFQMCTQSVLRESSEDEDEGEGENLAGEFLSSPPSPHSSSPSGLSQLALSVSVNSARLSMLLPIEESKSARVNPSISHANDSPRESLYASAMSEQLLLDIDHGGGEGEGERRSRETEEGGEGEDHGLAVIELSTLHFYVVSGYRGNRNHDYVCAYVDQFSLAHIGSLRSSGLSPFSAVSDSSHHTSLSKLHHILQRSPDRLQMRPTPRGVPLPHMILIAMDIRLEPERNSKTNKCAVALQNTLLNHHVTPPIHNCFKQLGDFLNLSEEGVEGVEPPSLITEMHLHLQDLRFEYCPLYLPMTVLMSVSSIQLSTSIVAGSPLLVVRILVDHTHLALSDIHQKPASLREDYVCVLDLDWFELTLRLCNTAQFEEESQKLFSHMPDVSLECSSNVLQIHTCVDSCIALRDLLVYLASDGDLHPRPSEPRDHSRRNPAMSSNSANLTSVTVPTSSSLPSASSLHPPSSSAPMDIGDLLSEAMDDLPPPPTRSTGATAGNSHTSVVGAEGTLQSHMTACESERSVTSKNKMQVVESDEKLIDIDFGDSEEEEGEEKEVQGGRECVAIRGGGSGATGSAGGQDGRGGSKGGVARGTAGREEGSKEDRESDEDFCILDSPTSTFVAPGSKPVVKCLLSEGETWKIVENHFAIPEHHVDQLRRPKHFPEPVLQYTLKEITILWHIYGGHDFIPSSPHSHTPSSGSSLHTPRPNSSSGSLSSFYAPSTNSRAKTNTSGSRLPSSSSTTATGYIGGAGVPGGRVGKKAPQSGRSWSVAGGAGRDHSVLMEVEVDKLRLQCETFPQDSPQASRLAFLVRDLEIRDRLAQSNINKFLYQYTTESMPRQSHANMVSLKVLTTRPELQANPHEKEVSIRLSILPIRLNIDQDAFYFLFEFFSQVSDSSSLNASPVSHPRPPPAMDIASSAQATTADQGNVFIRSFVFQPALPIKIDYTTKWRFPTDTMGTLAGILIGLYHLDNSELTLKSMNFKKGFLGWDSLVECVTQEWSTDIMSRQLPLILKGVGPTHYITQFVHGVVDLVRLPYNQYQEDGRIVWGLQQGASSFSTSTGVAVVELTSRTLETLQSVAQMVYDLVTPVPVEGQSGQALLHQRRAPHQPQDFREGVANAYDVVTAGLTGTAVDLYAVAAQEHEERGVTGAVGGILRQIPGTVVKPVILLSEATRHVLGGVKNQFVPDARKEAKEKWKAIETND